MGDRPQGVPDEAGAPTVAIVGAGLAGLTAGRRLQEAGLRVTVFDKGRRPGGRANTREHDAYRFDHGAQYFTARDSTVQGYVQSWIEQGVAAEWRGMLVRIDGEHREPAKPATRYVGVPGMIDVALHLARDLDVRTGIRIEELQWEEGGWTLRRDDDSVAGHFEQVVLAVPAPQALDLLPGESALNPAVGAVEMAPCWAGLLVFAEPLDLGFDGAFLADGPFSWIARNTSKPGRPPHESWVVHAGPAWTRKHRNVERDRVPGLMRIGLEERFGPLPRGIFQRAHRWGYALATQRVPGDALYDVSAGLGLCGDWCAGGRIGGALLSGMAVAEHILGQAP